METRYFITCTGVKHAIAAADNGSHNESFQLLLYLLKCSSYGPVSFSDLVSYFNNNKTQAFKEISKMISLQLIDMNESDSEQPDATKDKMFFLNSLSMEDDYILSDLNGLPISNHGFNQQQAISISAIAYDYIKASKRSRYESENTELKTPLSIKTSWCDIEIIIHLLYFKNLPCLLITKNSDLMNKAEFINLASYLYNRYSYEH